MTTITAALPPIGAAFTGTSASTAAITAGLPALTAHLSSGVPLVPPGLTGTATVRGLTGTATVT